MNKVDFPLWDNEVEKSIAELNRVTAQIHNVRKKMKRNDIIYGDDSFKIFYDNLCQTLNFWTGHTHVGHRKDKVLQKAFQTFFEALYDFLLFCQNEDDSFRHALRDLSNEALYQGTLYRYLGHSSEDFDIDSKVKPEYNSIYVSWSKNTKIPYVENKLCGTMTLLTCNVEKPNYGIDLEVFGAVRGDEAEVIFPTIKDTITDVRYIKR